MKKINKTHFDARERAREKNDEILSSDVNKCRHVPQCGGGRRARHMTPDLSYYWKGTRELCEDNECDENICM